MLYNRKGPHTGISFSNAFERSRLKKRLFLENSEQFDVLSRDFVLFLLEIVLFWTFYLTSKYWIELLTTKTAFNNTELNFLPDFDTKSPELKGPLQPEIPIEPPLASLFYSNNIITSNFTRRFFSEKKSKTQKTKGQKVQIKMTDNQKKKQVR